MSIFLVVEQSSTPSRDGVLKQMGLKSINGAYFHKSFTDPTKAEDYAKKVKKQARDRRVSLYVVEVPCEK